MSAEDKLKTLCLVFLFKKLCLLAIMARRTLTDTTDRSSPPGLLETYSSKGLLKIKHAWEYNKPHVSPQRRIAEA